MRILRLDVEAHADAASAGEIERAGAGHGAAARGRPLEALDPELRTAEAADRLEIVDDHSGDRAFEPGTGRPDRAVDDGIFERAAKVRADRRRPAEVDELNSRQPPQGVGGAVVAKLGPHRRPDQPIEQVAAAADRRNPGLGPADGPALAHRDRAHRRIDAVEPRVEADVDRPRRQDQARPCEPADPEIGFPSRRRVGGRRAISDQSRGDAAEPELGVEDVEDRERHRRQLGVDLGPGAEQAAQGGGAAGKAQAGVAEPPPVRSPGQQGRTEQFDRAAVDGAAAAYPVAAGRGVGDEIEGKAAAARAGDPRLDPADAAAKAGQSVDIGDIDGAAAETAGDDPTFDRGPCRIEDDDARNRAAPDDDRRRADEAGVVRGQVDGDALVRPDRIEHQGSGQAAARDIEPAGEAARIRSQQAGRPSARDVERVKPDRRRLPRQKEDPAVSGERTQSRAAFGPPGETAFVRLEVHMDVGKPERGHRIFEPDREPRPLEPPFEADPERAVNVMGSAPFHREGAVAPSEALRRQADERRRDTHIGEMDDPVRTAVEICLKLRQSAGNPVEETIVHPPNRSAGDAGHRRSAAARPGDGAKLAQDVDLTEAGYLVARQREIERDGIDARAKIDAEAAATA